MSMCRFRPRASAQAARAEGGPRGATPTSLRMLGQPVPSLLVTVGNSRVELPSRIGPRKEVHPDLFCLFLMEQGHVLACIF